MRSLITSIVVVFLLSSCDKIEQPLELLPAPVDTTNLDLQYNDTTYSDTTKLIRKIVLEDFTGHTCGNCPEAAEIANSLKEKYKDTLIVVSVHAGGFAKPRASGDKYRTDFRTPAGDEYDPKFIGSSGNPNGLISRTGYLADSVVKSPKIWANTIQAYLNNSAFMQPRFKIKLRNIYNSKSNTILLKATVEALEAASANFAIVTYVLEDNITDWQMDYRLPSGQQDIPDYKHKHVLRQALPGTWGEDLLIAPASAGDIVEKTFSYELPASLSASNVTLVTYIYDKTTFEIIQAEEIHIAP